LITAVSQMNTQMSQMLTDAFAIFLI
jgi:hypothetical protein